MDVKWVQSLFIVNFSLETLTFNQTVQKTLESFSFPFFSTHFLGEWIATLRKILAVLGMSASHKQAAEEFLLIPVGNKRFNSTLCIFALRLCLQAASYPLNPKQILPM